MEEPRTLSHSFYKARSKNYRPVSHVNMDVETLKKNHCYVTSSSLLKEQSYMTK